MTVEFGQLAPADWSDIRSDPERYGFKAADVPTDLDVTQAISLAARSGAGSSEDAGGSSGGSSGGKRLCGFLVATLEPMQRARRQQVGGSGPDGAGNPFRGMRGGESTTSSSTSGGGGSGDADSELTAAEDDAALVLAALRAEDDVILVSEGVEVLQSTSSSSSPRKLPNLGIALQLLGIDYGGFVLLCSFCLAACYSTLRVVLAALLASHHFTQPPFKHTAQTRRVPPPGDWRQPA